MPEVICTTVYQFPELSDAAKEKARSWYREAAFHEDWWDAVYDDFERICEILGVSPVSYTHLDVYKRQIIFIALALSELPGTT